MPEYLDDPSVLTKDKLKSELVANNVELPSGNPTKDVFVQLYLKNLTVQNKKNATLDAFSSDEELPPPVVSNRSRSSGRKATRKTDKARPEDLDVTELTAEGLKDELLKYGVDAGPIVASTRKLYEKKLQKLLDQGPPQPLIPHVVLAEIDANHNGNSDSDRYSDKEEEETALPEPEPVPVPEPEPEPVPEPAPVVERPVRSRGKTPVTTRTRSSQHNKDVPTPGIPHCKSKIVPKDLRPVLTDQVQAKSNSTVHHSAFSPAKTESPSLNSRPAKGPAGAALSCAVRERCVALKPRHSPPVKTPINSHPEDHRAPESPRWKLHKEGVGIPPPKLFKASPRQPVALLNTTWLEEPQPNVKASVGQSVIPLRPVALSLPEEPSLRLAAKPSGPSPSLVHLGQIDPITFSPMCDISPIKDQESHWSLSGRFESKASGGSAVAEKQVPSDTQLRKGRQQKITPFLSTLSPVKTHGCVAVVSKEPQFKEVEKIAAGDQTPRVEERNVLKEMFPNEINSPTGISATCRRPIRGAAGRPVKSSDLWNDENFLRSAKSINTTTTSSYTESRSVHRVTNMPPSTPSSSASSSSSRLVSAAPPTGQTKAARRSLSLWIKLFLLAVVATFLFFVYQAMETNAINPFGGSDTEQTSSGSAENVASK